MDKVGSSIVLMRAKTIKNRDLVLVYGKFGAMKFVTVNHREGEKEWASRHYFSTLGEAQTDFYKRLKEDSEFLNNRFLSGCLDDCLEVLEEIEAV